MIRLNSKPLSDQTTTHLTARQTDIDGQTEFADKAARAVSLWAGKGGAIAGRDAFDEVKKMLVLMCVGTEGCNYCESDQATDVEHIYPKSLFPERAFLWSNYLLACKTCNTAYKLDKFAIFNPVGSTTSSHLPRNNPPVNDDAVLIDPRQENPEDYLWLDIQGRTFWFTARPNGDPRYAIKAEYTIQLLGLNDRNKLVAERQAAAKYYLDRLRSYIDVREATDFMALDACVHDPELIDETIPFADERARILFSHKKDIVTYAHPTVWLELKRQREQLPRTKKLFEQAPEALNW